MPQSVILQLFCSDLLLAPFELAPHAGATPYSVELPCDADEKDDSVLALTVLENIVDKPTVELWYSARWKFDSKRRLSRKIMLDHLWTASSRNLFTFLDKLQKGDLSKIHGKLFPYEGSKIYKRDLVLCIEAELRKRATPGAAHRHASDRLY